ncbi:polyribonucleotide nucleotidyltransferase [Lachnospiraceae bacterium oral taxon 500]|nr:polyribonucleotide nucleotidyltransferase [Lachnospiraceae bacterium oral taxon 500]
MIYSKEIAGRVFSVETGKVAEQASAAVIARYGDTVVLSVVTASEEPRPGIDFFPLSVDYEEKLYSVGKIPGGFIKREGRPSENAILTSRLIDRPIRPLFPKDYRNDCTVVNTVLSVDQDCPPEFAAMLGSSIALSISEVPFLGPISSIIVGRVNGELVYNPTAAQREVTEMTLVVSSTAEKVIMIDMDGKEIPEEDVLQAIFAAHEVNKEIIAFIKEIQAVEGKPKAAYIEVGIPAEMNEAMYQIVDKDRMEDAVYTESKNDRKEKMQKIKEDLTAAFSEGHEDWLELIDEALYQYQKKTVRRMILKEKKRPDGRAIEEIRHLAAEVDLLPRTHGSALFTRGETQVLNITTLGALAEMQRLDGIDELETSKRYMHHYNFPGYSVGEAKTSRGPGRREIGHGALAQKALIPVLPSEEEFPYAIRTVSEVLSSNGSTSQASICASSLSLMAAGVPIKKAVAGITCGLVTGETDDDYILLTDIQGLEDFFGDMDFKVAGTTDGITAIQLDMKVAGITNEMIRGAIANTRKSRLYILNEIMNKAIAEPRAELSPYAPKIMQLTISVDKIGEVVGARGKTINRIIEETGVQIDIEDDGRVFIISADQEMANKARRIIETIDKGVQVGDVFEGKVMRIMNFGAFVELVPGQEGLVHISKLDKTRVAKVEDVVQIGDIVRVKVVEIDDQGRVNLSRKALL